MSAITPPPQYAQRLGSDDPDEVTAWAARRDGLHSRVVRGSGPYGFRAAVLEGRTVGLAWARTRLGQTLRGRFRHACVHVPIDGAQRYTFGRSSFFAAPGSLVFIAPGTETSRHSGAGSVFAMDIDEAALLAEVQLRRPTDRPVTWPQFPQALEPPGPMRRAFDRAVTDLARGLGPESASSQWEHREGRVIAALADVLVSRPAGIGAERLTARRVADLEAWIDAHLTDPITTGRLCAVSRVGERSLQLAFRARRGMSPMRFVFERRLAAAHRQLANAGVEDDITGIATRLGFTHLGRFSLAYREAFGESPSHTMRRSRRTSDPASS